MERRHWDRSRRCGMVDVVSGGEPVVSEWNKDSRSDMLMIESTTGWYASCWIVTVNSGSQ